jgi:hypothetical protein
VTSPAATLVADNVCEVRITASGSFTPPTGITKLAGVLIGAGAGAGEFLNTTTGDDIFYAGSGGDVVYVDSIPLGAPLAITIGAAGESDTTAGGTPTSGGDTIVGTDGAVGAAFAPVGASCSPAANIILIFGNGAQTDGSVDGTGACVPGVGYALSQLAGVDPALFPAAADGTAVYGDGGIPSETGATAAVDAGDGGSVDTTGAAHHFDGAAGLVILRFVPAAPVAPTAPSLAATGSAVPWFSPAGSVAAILAGAVLLIATRRRRAAR